MQTNIPKNYFYLIIVWSIVCASGLGIFLFQALGPALPDEPAYTGTALAITVIFWIIVWALPSAILFFRGRREKG